MAAALAALHYLALAIGFSALTLRGVRMQEGSLTKILNADNFWGIAALLWIVTGLLRAFGGFEKGSDYYLHSHWFWLKMTLFLGVFLLELWPMTTFIKWRVSKKSSLENSDRELLKRFVLINRLQSILVLLIPVVAVCMARGI